MKKNGSNSARDSEKQKMTMKMFVMPICAYCVQMRTTSLEDSVVAVVALRFMFSLM